MIAFLRDESGRLACEQVSPGQAWAGLWRFPAFDSNTMELLPQQSTLPAFKYGITKYRVTLQVVEARWKRSILEEPAPIYANNANRGFFTEAELEERAMAAPHRKALKQISSRSR
jgi:adenine-specific DNA glycosylase